MSRSVQIPYAVNLLTFFSTCKNNSEQARETQYKPYFILSLTPRVTRGSGDDSRMGDKKMNGTCEG